jgi:DNA replicative helicase MCM subunit Mcm2 (Cdc46/Mcm family)
MRAYQKAAEDKRLMVVESEFASVLRILGRDGNTLSPTIRQAWDSGNLNTMTKNQPAKATRAHISIVGHVTQDELQRYLDRTEMGNGFANRFLFACVRRSKCLPEGGNIEKVDFMPMKKRLQSAIDFARKQERISWNQEARSLWHEVYPELSAAKPSLFGAVVARAEAQVVRLATIYALLDCSTSICKDHLEAALALWKFCEDSARYIFGNSLGDPTANEILKELRKKPDGMTRTDIRDYFQKHKTNSEIERSLHLLEEVGLARTQEEKTAGRSVERWFACSTATKAT